MRTMIVVSCLLLAGGTARATPKGIRNTGIVLTLVGVGLTLAGIGTLATLATEPPDCRYECRDGHGIAISMGGSLLGVGLLHLGVGVPLWVVGQYQANLSLAPTADRRGAAAQISWRF